MSFPSAALFFFAAWFVLPLAFFSLPRKAGIK